MSESLFVAMADDSPLPTTAEHLAVAFRAHWGSDAVVDRPLVSEHLERTLRIRDDDGAFRVDVRRGMDSVNVDGTPEQNEVVACLVRAALPVDAPRVIAYDGSWGWHAELVAGITPQTFADHVVEHDERWADPELEA